MAHNALDETTAIHLQSLVQQLTTDGFKTLRQWLFDAQLQIDQFTVPLKDVPGNAVLQDTARFDPKDETVVRDLMDFSAASICRTRRVSHLRDLYGEKTWTMGLAEWREIQATTCVYTSPMLPRRFFVRLVRILSSDQNAQFWKEQSHQSLNNIWHTVNMAVPEKYKKSLEALQGLLEEVRRRGFREFGFVTEEDFRAMLNTSISSLATSVCVAQNGYCLLDDDNQLQERPPAEMVFLSACAPDFLDPEARPQARQELQKYFVPPNNTGKWRSHGAYHGKHALRERIMGIWKRVFTACADQQVTHPSLLPMGLGIFRPRVTEPDVIPLYFEAQLTVLQSNDYAFDTVFLNPGANKKELLDVLSRKQWQFPFHLKIHHCDAKSVANHLARIGKRSCILIPADFLSVLQGFVGSWWECGFNERYTGESHIVSTSTTILARKGVCEVWNGTETEQRIKTIDAASVSVSASVVPVCSYVYQPPPPSQPLLMTFAEIVFIDFPQWWGADAGDAEPEDLKAVTEMIRRSQFGAIDVQVLDVDFFQRKIAEIEAAAGPEPPTNPKAYEMGLREEVFARLTAALCDKGAESGAIDDLNAVVIRLDFTMLKAHSRQLALLIAALVDLRTKSLFYGAIMCACVGSATLSTEAIRHAVSLGADWVFTYPGLGHSRRKASYPVQ